jgi:prolyl-tRNA synthetase
MRQSTLFTKLRKEAPKDEVSKNAQLLIRAGFIHKEMAGVYSLLPLGLQTLNRITAIIREEMNAIGGVEAHLSALQNKESWEVTNRWSDDVVEIWFKTSLKGGGDLGLGFTHEESLTALMREHISSYRDLPRAVYQIQTKFRNELRAKSGIMRGREFLMKDLYSFSRSEEEHAIFYEKAKQAYGRIFERLGIGERTYLTFASGGSFSKFSHEFQMLTDAGEDTIYVHEEKGIAINEEVLIEEVLAELGVRREELTPQKAVEVGNIFSLGTRFSEPLGLRYKDEAGVPQSVVMGSYGIGPTRLLGAIVEAHADDRGIVWPLSVAPFVLHLVSLANGDDSIARYADELYEELTAHGVSVLYDDRGDVRAGEKFAESDLLGMPYRIIVGKKASDTEMIEVVERKTGEVTERTREEVLALQKEI